MINRNSDQKIKNRLNSRDDYYFSVQFQNLSSVGLLSQNKDYDLRVRDFSVVWMGLQLALSY